MKNKIKIILIVLCCLLVCGCSNIKAIRNRQLSKDEVSKLVTDSLSQYEDLDVKLDKVDKAYTVEGELIRNGKSYYYEITDKDGNKAYANYRDAFKIDNEVYESSFIESYIAIYHNKNELNYYKYLADKYIEKDDIVDTYYASDYEEVDYFTKAKVVYKLNYKLKDITWEQYANLLKLGYDIKKYRLETYGTLNYDDPEVYILFKGSNKYYHVSHYGLIEDKGTQYKNKIKLVDDYTDIYNLKNYLTFTVGEEELNKVNNHLNSYGKYLLDNVHSISVKSDEKNGYILINNYSKNDYLLNLLIKFKYDTESNSFIFQNINMLQSSNIGVFDDTVVESW